MGNRREAIKNICYSPITVIMGGLAGSEAKGSAVGYLSDPHNPDNINRLLDLPKLSVVRTGGPNAGHYVKYRGKAYAMQQVPVGWINPDAQLYLGPGSLVNPEVLRREIGWVEAELGKGNLLGRLWIDRHATVIEPKHHDMEVQDGMNAKIGSTAEGVGAAQADKVMRRAKVFKELEEFKDYVADVGAILRAQVRAKDTAVLVESTQGVMLSLNGPQYPFTTSRDIVPGQVLADAGLPSNFPHSVILVMRTYPIRVAGNSGDIGQEVTWEQLSEQSGGYIQPERTTVTKRIRRIAKWNPDWARYAVEITNADAIILSFFDYERPDLANKNILDSDAMEQIKKFEKDAGAPILWVSTGFQNIIPLYKKDLF